jgi:hypothetical protein
MENEVGPVAMSPDAIELMGKLSRAGYELSWTKKFRDYPTILDDIEASDGLLAIADDTWTSSTWMAIEAHHALGNGSNFDRRNPKLIPTFVYPLLHCWIMGAPYTEHFRLLTILELDVNQAVLQIESVLATQ